jgi:hypothetical protein
MDNALNEIQQFGGGAGATGHTLGPIFASLSLRRDDAL